MVTRKLKGALKRQGKAVALSLALVFGGLSLWQAWDVVTHLQDQARETSQMYGEIITALGDPGAETTALLNMSERISASGIPLVVTSAEGRPIWVANLPPSFGRLGMFLYRDDDPEIREYVAELDRLNPALDIGGQLVHFGSPPSDTPHHTAFLLSTRRSDHSNHRRSLGLSYIGRPPPRPLVGRNGA